MVRQVADDHTLVRYVDGLLHQERASDGRAVTGCGHQVEPAEGWVRVDELWLRHLNLDAAAYCLRCFPEGRPGEARPLDAGDRGESEHPEPATAGGEPPPLAR